MQQTRLNYTLFGYTFAKKLYFEKPFYLSKTSLEITLKDTFGLSVLV